MHDMLTRLIFADALAWAWVAGLGWPLWSRWGERLGWWCARYQLDRMHQVSRLRELQDNLVLLRAGGWPLMTAAAREQELEYIRPLTRRPPPRAISHGWPPTVHCPYCCEDPRHRKMSEGGYDC